MTMSSNVSTLRQVFTELPPIGVVGAAQLVRRSNADAWCGSVLMARLMAVFVRSRVLGWTAASVCMPVVAWGVPMDARPVPPVLLTRRGRLRRPAGGRLLGIPQRAEDALDVSAREEE
jgi:hypothetical protein